MSIGKRVHVRVFTDDSSNDMIVTTSSLDLCAAWKVPKKLHTHQKKTSEMETKQEENGKMSEFMSESVCAHRTVCCTYLI